MVMELVLGTLTLIVLLIAAYTDLKTREVPDWLNYAFIFAAVGIRTLFSFQDGWFTVVSGFLGLMAGLLLACVFYYTNQWGGGDGKLLMGLGATIGIAYPFTAASLALLWYFLLVLLIGALFGLLWMSVIALPKRLLVGREWKKYLFLYKGFHLGTAALSLALLLVSIQISLSWWLVPVPLLFFYLFLFVLSVEKVGFCKEIPIGNVTEGDWLAQAVRVNGKKIRLGKTLEKSDLAILYRLAREKKISTVVIKQGVPLVPSFLLAYLMMMFGKEWVLNILGRMMG